MSLMKRAYEEEHPEIFEGDEGEREDVQRPPEFRSLFGCDFNGDTAEVEGRVFYAGDDAELNDALDAYLTRTPPAEAD
jgi:hypothetical protein